ncbi:MAG: hypothetical protein OQJ99_04000 [Rhodospirillales bacterium]|nr:hypothetical protein [Rhodospirillales bacterium]MCW8862573.1 hypothetical protein [Rhodospirillales bacterium]MCW8951622.1 hypothetical protein [Rhodospirillales bacterium]MCW8970728.1 hypothetical protein [Rhodospirillales bacterium]MCW9003303.1 hypothetical protein [Rhodospirillales bacterium]
MALIIGAGKDTFTPYRWSGGNPLVVVHPSLHGKSYIFRNFFEVTGAQRDNLLRNYNQAAPQTNYNPDMIGYDWAPTGNALLVFVRDEWCPEAESNHRHHDFQ